MTDHISSVHNAEHSSGSDTTPPNHLGGDVPSGAFDEKKAYINDNEKSADLPPKKDLMEDDDEEDEDIDALIEELESQDANADEEDEEVQQPGGARPVPEELLQTDGRIGLTTEEVDRRRKKFGLNQMKEEKENLILKFLGYFVGPIQFVMQVSLSAFLPLRPHTCAVALLLLTRAIATGCCRACRRSAGLGRLWCHLRAAFA